MFSDAKRQVKVAEILPKCRYHKEGAAIIHELLKKGSISDTIYDNLISAEIGDQLLLTNMFVMHFNSGEIGFKSTVMKRFCEENSALWERK